MPFSPPLLEPETEVLLWILGSGLAMSALALVGVIVIVLPKRFLDRLLLPMVAFAAGSLLGGAFFHLLPEAVARTDQLRGIFLWTAIGFTAFLLLEQFLRWHHSHDAPREGPRPEAYLILLGDGLHNVLGGLAVGASFVVDVRLGLLAWLAAAAHEVPQELGDFAILVHGGFPRARALVSNFLSALAFPLGGVVAWWMGGRIDVLFLVPFAAGNFLYIGASDLIPEIKAQHGGKRSVLHLACFVLGLMVLWTLGAGLDGAG